MNRFRLNNKIHNHIAIYPVNEDIKFNNDIEEQTWAEDIWTYLQDAPLNRVACFVKDKPKDKHYITVWTDDKYVYMIFALRTEWNTTKTTIYRESLDTASIDDYKAIAKWTHYNLHSIAKDYRKLIIDAKKYAVDNKINVVEDNYEA